MFKGGWKRRVQIPANPPLVVVVLPLHTPVLASRELFELPPTIMSSNELQAEMILSVLDPGEYITVLGKMVLIVTFSTSGTSILGPLWSGASAWPREEKRDQRSFC